MISDQSPKKVVVLGTGGTIAGKAASASDNLGYTAAQVGIADLLAQVPGMTGALGGHDLVSEQVAQIDSKDMSFAVWQALAQRVQHHLAQPEVKAVVITHGTDTLEETAYFLHAVLPLQWVSSKPVVLTCAMRPATSLSPDGPQNLLDAIAVALCPQACGVMVVAAGSVHGALDVQKTHTYRPDAFSSGDAGALGYVEEGQLRLLRNWPLDQSNKAPIAIEKIANFRCWPRVEIVMNYAGGSAYMVDAMLQPLPDVPALQGLVVAATGNGTIHQALEAALRRASQAGVRVVRTSRCANGRVLATVHAEFAHFEGLSPVKARVALMLALMPAD